MTENKVTEHMELIPEDNSNRAIRRWLMVSGALYIIAVLNFMEPFDINYPYFNVPYHILLSLYGAVVALVVWLIFKFCPEQYAIQNFTKSATRLFLWILMLVVAISMAFWLYSMLFRATLNGWNNIYVPVYKFTELTPQFFAMLAPWGLLSWLFICFFPEKEPVILLNQEMILLPSDNQSDGFKIKPAHLVCLKTCDNYLEVYYLNEHDELQNRMIRSSMKKMEENLGQQFFFRSHQSYLVNLAHIKGLKKVQNNHFLEMAYLDFDVAISRKNVKHMKTHVLN